MIERFSHDLGIDLVGLLPTQPAPHFDFFQAWLAQGRGEGMAYLGRRLAERSDVRKLMPEARSVIMTAMVYKQPEDQVAAQAAKGFKIAQYAWGEDYHHVFKTKLEQLGALLKAEIPEMTHRAYVDTGPILERDYAALAGLGWIGKNTCLIHPRKGSYLFLGSLLTTLECPESNDTPAPMADHCGTCRACLDACPTGALEPYTLDPKRCIAYWTIEHRGEFPDEIVREAKEKWQDWVFGCDICQAVCPWNRKAPVTTHAEFRQSDMGSKFSQLTDLIDIKEEDLAHSPMQRTTASGLRRNAAAQK